MTKKEPLIRIVKRNHVTWKTKFFSYVGTLLGALVLSVLFLWIVSGKNPFPALGYIVLGSFENKIKIWSMLKELVLLLGIGLALVPAYKMRFWNIGAQGQVLMGALMASMCMIKLAGKVPNALLVVIELFAAITGGALFAYIPAFFKSKWNTNETLFTLMMNYIAVFVVTYFTDVWRGIKSSLGTINPNTEAGWLSFVTGNKTIDTFTKTYMNQQVLIPMVVVIFLMILMHFYLKYFKHGYELTVVGDSISTARYTGINVGHVMRRTLFLSGAICGLIGFFYVSCFDHTISGSTSGGYGFTAVIVCWLSNFNPFIMVIYSFLIIFLQKGARNLSNVSYAPALNEYSTEFLIFLVIIALLLVTFFVRYRFQVKPNSKKLVRTLTKGLDLEGGAL